MKLEDIFGAEFGTLTAIARAGVDHGNTVWLCVCLCGATHLVRRDRLPNKVCGRCAQLKKHRHGAGPHRFTLEEVTERFWKQVEKTSGCWLWRGAIRTSNRSASQTRGRVFFNRRAWFVHRFSWFVTTGEHPGEKTVCHACDVPLCVNPAHLFLGTQQINIADMDRKGRRVPPRGERNRSAKLTAEQVLAIRARVADGAAHAELAREFRVNPTTIRGIAIGRLWKHVA